MHPSNPLVNVRYSKFVLLYHRPSQREPTEAEVETLLRHGAGERNPTFICWFKEEVLFNFICCLYLTLNLTNI
jgi:hypothetical protein